MKASRGWRWIKEGGRSGDGAVEGEIWGGCLPSLMRILGTEWDVSYEGKIMIFGTYFHFVFIFSPFLRTRS